MDDLLDIDAGGNPLRRKSVGGYLLGERTLLRLGAEGGRFLSAFGRYTWTDGDSTPVTNSLNLGMHVRGPVVVRPGDLLGVACTRSGLSSKFRQMQVRTGTEIARSEVAVELTYRMQISPWLAFQPVIQQIRHPGGASAMPTARLIGIRAEFAL